MDFINKLELQGRVGLVSTCDINGTKKIVHFKVETNKVYLKSNNPYMDTATHEVEVWDYDGRLANLAKGQNVHLFGWLKYNSYRAADGRDRREVVIRAKSQDVTIMES